MFPMRWLLHMSRWSRNPPSARRVKLLLALLVVVVIIVTLDMTGFWPDWARMDRPPRPRIPSGLP